MLFIFFGSLVLIFVVVGFYGVVVYIVSEYCWEIGICIVVGVSGGEVVMYFFKSLMCFVVFVLSFGFVGLFVMGCLLLSFLYGV